jgi:CMP/dCMP kinase
MNEQVITIDGPSGAGKSTISRLLASHLGFAYLDTGAMYRCVALKAEQTRIDPENNEVLVNLLNTIKIELKPGEGGTQVFLDNNDVSGQIRTPEMGLAASKISALPAVREKLGELQRDIGSKSSIVAEGRDMGTVVFPEALHKFYLDASPEERARRRLKQLEKKGQFIDFNQLLTQITKRDHDDQSRAIAPLKPAKDAVIIDSSHMSAHQVVDFMKIKLGR